MVERSKLKLEKLNQQRISVLVQNKGNVVGFKDFFEGHGYIVDISDDATQLYDALCSGGEPGFVFVSTQAESSMAKMMPDFVINRFAIPVFLFREDPMASAPNEPSAGVLPPEILLVVDYGLEQLLDTIKQFEVIYHARLNGRGRTELVQVKDRVSQGSPEATSGPPGTASKSDEVLHLVRDLLVEQEVGISADDVISIHACKVSEPVGQGYFVFGFPARLQQEEMDQAVRNLEERIRESAGAGVVIEHFTQGVPANFFQNIREHSDEIMMGKLSGRDMVLLYFRNRKEVHRPDLKVISENILVPIEHWWTNMPLPCSAYVWLQMNERKVLFVRSGDSMRSEAYVRFTGKGHSHLAVSVDDFEHYLKIREMIHVALAA